ncbi:FG-nucleoporin nsp1 [Elasticomyces elasticus]|uniref:FG-nucleoporin nsp1 n=1 Tax=Exophiala sideris TaxID=1016849 RepID=A0ABR0JCW3_9EURO|nr:FG-nucleoporin nsp1 [Elasticomyces elasticus]KAK5031324.1 FG-nucleoporin nsp1 [Exophiala sideris]KAK5039044.1 FG-nucleoporin nsp1 [Exophiala sideris]KAK5060929.1 FG-nucleoporin nsp1 [Exophiala sideris]KAK5183840.1 FG-nucleoporin nsp1 [Eurotiomycetes sp. CCFEE 6388]
MAFNFGAPASTGGGSGQSLFGSANNKPASGGGLFGNAGAPGTNTTGFSFGNASQTTSNAPSSQGLFGAAGSTENKSATPSLFGQPAGSGSAAPSGGLFGAKKPEETQSNDTSKPTFSFGTPDKSAAPPSSAPSLFGTPAASNTSNSFSFNPSTTPAGPPPSSSTFGASTGGAGLFGAKPADDAAKPGVFGLNKPAAPAEAATASSTNSGGLFGSKPAPASGGFNFGAPSKPAESTPAPAAAANNTTSNNEPPKPTFSFGAPTSTSSGTPAAPSAQPTTSASASSLFGEAPKPNTGSNLFSTKPATTETAAPAKPAFSFGPPPTQPSAAPAQTTSAPPQKPLFGGLNLGGGAAPSTSSESAPATSTATSAPASKPFSFGPPPTTTTAQPAATPAPSASPFSFPSSTATSAPQPTTTTTTAAPATGTATAPLGGQSTVGAQTSTAGPAPPAQSRLRNKTMDEILTRWATDMSRYSKEFKEQAETIARWDQLIVDNSSKIDKLYVRTRTCERQTMSVDMQLAAVENQQTELESWLTKYENDVDDMLAKDNANPSELGGPDQERERTYKLAEKLGERLEEMERDLGSMVEEVNAANTSLSKNGKADEPITQIVKILNSHLMQLQAIDQGTVALQEKVAAAQKSASSLGYLNGSTNGNNGAAVQDFYRSYMGRR